MLATKIWIPIRSPSPTEVGSDKYYAYAPIAVADLGDFGTGKSLGQLRAPYPAANFADSATRTPLNFLIVTSLDLSIETPIGKYQLSRTSPPTVQADELQWHTTGDGIGPISFTLHNPFAADELSRNTFIAGISLSVGATALLLLLEKLIDSWIRRRKLRMQEHPAEPGGTPSVPG